MSSHTLQDNTHSSQGRNGVAVAVLALVGVAWLLGTPVLVDVAWFMSGAFFGEPPSASEMTSAFWSLVGAGVCGVVAPIVAAVVARRRGWRRTAQVFSACVVITVVAGVIAQAVLT